MGYVTCGKLLATTEVQHHLLHMLNTIYLKRVVFDVREGAILLFWGRQSS